MEKKMAAAERRIGQLERTEHLNRAGGRPYVNSEPLPEEYLEVTKRDDNGRPTEVRIKEDLKLHAMTYQNRGRAKMAKVMMEKLYTKEERKHRNVNGLRGKAKLDPVKMAAIKETVFQLEPSTKADKELCWSECVKQIDAMNRQIDRHSVNGGKN